MKAALAVILGLALLPFVLTHLAEAENDELAVIVNKDNQTNVMTRDALRLVFQTVKTEWGDGKKTDPLNLPPEDPLRQEFDRAVLGLDPDRVIQYWIDRKIRGGERPPRKVASEQAALRAVANTQGSVGYVRASTADRSVKIVARIRSNEVVTP